MKKLTLMLSLLGLAFAGTIGAFASVSGERSVSNGVVFAQEDCKDGEKWNEDTQKCEPSGD